MYKATHPRILRDMQNTSRKRNRRRWKTIEQKMRLHCLQTRINGRQFWADFQWLMW